MDVEHLVAPATTSMSLPRALVLLLRVAGLLLLWWLAMISLSGTAQADARGHRDPVAREALSAAADAHRVPVVREAASAPADATRAAVDRTVAVARSVTGTPPARALTPVTGPVLDTVDAALADPAVGILDQPTEADSPTSSVDETPAARPGVRSVPPASAVELQRGATAAASASTSPIAATPSAVDESARVDAPADQPDLPDLPSGPGDRPSDGSTGTSPGSGPGGLSVLPGGADEHGTPVVRVERPRPLLPPRAPAYEPGSTPD